MNIPLVQGREFDDRDRMNSSLVTVVSKALAQNYFPNQNPIGKHLSFGFPPNPGVSREIIGIVDGVHDVSVGDISERDDVRPLRASPVPRGLPRRKNSARSRRHHLGLRGDVASLDKDLPLTDVATMTEVRTDVDHFDPNNTRTFLLGIFAAMALILAATGIFGVISYSVSCRTNEIGIRVALGTSSQSILKMVLGETLTLAAIGLAGQKYPPR